MAELKVVIFDCDGVMFDSREANRQYYNLLLKRFGRPAMDADELDYVHAHHVMDSLRYIFRRYPDDLEAADNFRKSLDYRPFLDFMIMEPDLKDFLHVVRRRCKTAISTNRTNTMAAVLDIFGLASLFDIVVTAMDVANTKPHPEALQKILEHVNASPEEGIYIGDSMVDREHSANMGIKMVAFKNAALPAEYHVSSFMEITTLPFFQA
jgi:HAD superfamily hydrolase (TIGR01509 family)